MFYKGNDRNLREVDNLMQIIYDWLETDEYFEYKQIFDAMREAIKKNPNEVVKIIDNMSYYLQESMLDHKICPYCGGDIECEDDDDRDIYAETDCGWAKVDQGFRWVCSDCGEEYDL